MGVADLCDACNDWSTVGLQLRKMWPTKVADFFCVGDDKCRQHLSASVNGRLVCMKYDIMFVLNNVNTA